MNTLKRLSLAILAIAASGALVVGIGIANAETPAERCKRETTAYNNAWKNTWAQANPGKSPSDAPPPPVPYRCGGGNDDPPPTLSPSAPEDEAGTPSAPSTTAPTSEDRGPGPNLNAPTERRDLEHPGSEQPTIAESRASSASTSPRSAPTSTPRTPTPTSAASTSRSPSSQPTPSRAAIDAAEPLKRNASEGNNDTSDSACVRIWGTEQRIGSNCHHYRDEVRQISADFNTDYSMPFAACGYNPDTDHPCTLSTSRSVAVTVGFTGGGGVIAS